MQLISNDSVRQLNISPLQCVGWVREAFSIKKFCGLPVKSSLHPSGSDFINTMPCLLPEEYGVFGCKIVSRHKGMTPLLQSHLTLFDSFKGELLALFEADWITTMRTGAVAALAVEALSVADASVIAIVGLGATARASLACIASLFPEREMEIRVFEYKDHVSGFIEEFSDKENLTFRVCRSMRELVSGADVVISCVSEAPSLLVEDPAWFSPGTLLIPVHTRGFQNCDLVFDRIVADDEPHVAHFSNFAGFRSFTTLDQVIEGNSPGRLNRNERIISYNIGIAVHDVVFAHKIYKLITSAERI